MTIKYLLIVYVSLMLHEIGHFLIALIIHAKIIKFSVTLFGINMQINTNDLSFNRKLALFFSGPLTNILIMLFSYNYKLNDVALINIFLSLINLLPIMPLDGGNVLKTVLERYIKKEYVYKIIMIINIIFLAISVYCFYITFNIVYLAVVFMALKGIFYEKTLILEEKIKNTYKKYM